LAARIDAVIDVDPAFSDDRFEVAPGESLAALAGLARGGTDVAVCSQGDTIIALLRAIGDDTVRHRATTAKGAAWVLGCRDGEVVSADYYGASAYRAVRRR
jgi:hypothetical protein